MRAFLTGVRREAAIFAKRSMRFIPMLSHAAVGFLRCRHKCGPNRVPDIKTAASAAQIAGAVPTKIGVELVDWVKDPSFY